MSDDFEPWAKIPRFSNLYMQVTEKLDGTNAQIAISPDGTIRAGSRTRWITPEDDNYGFAGWVKAHHDELLKLGHGRHYGEWWGVGIGRGYGLYERRFSLFNPDRYAKNPNLPACVSTVPVLYRGGLNVDEIHIAHKAIVHHGSQAAPGFPRPEGVVIWCQGSFWKITDAAGKGSKRLAQEAQETA